MLFATHLNIGTPETLDLFRSFAKDIKQYPKYDGTRIVWVHLLPFYQETLKHYFNLNRDYQVQCTEMNLDYMDELDTTHPLEALATKMLNNLYNGPYEKKANMVVKLAKEMHAMDRRNSHNGQIKTRLEAFLEILDKERNSSC